MRFELNRELNLCQESSVSLVALLVWVPIVTGSQCHADNGLMRLLLASSQQPSLREQPWVSLVPASETASRGISLHCSMFRSTDYRVIPWHFLNLYLLNRPLLFFMIQNTTIPQWVREQTLKIPTLFLLYRNVLSNLCLTLKDSAVKLGNTRQRSHFFLLLMGMNMK